MTENKPFQTQEIVNKLNEIKEYGQFSRWRSAQQFLGESPFIVSSIAPYEFEDYKKSEILPPVLENMITDGILRSAAVCENTDHLIVSRSSGGEVATRGDNKPCISLTPSDVNMEALNNKLQEVRKSRSAAKA